MRFAPFLAGVLNYCVHATTIETYHYAGYAGRAGVGDVVAEVADVESVTSCVTQCAASDDCTSVNYSNNTCTLLQVQDPLDDWHDAHNATYMCENHQVDFTGGCVLYYIVADC